MKKYKDDVTSYFVLGSCMHCRSDGLRGGNSLECLDEVKLGGTEIGGGELRADSSHEHCN